MKRLGLRLLLALMLFAPLSCETLFQPPVRPPKAPIPTPPKPQPNSECVAPSALPVDTSSRPRAVLNGPKHFSYTYFDFENADRTIKNVSVDLILCNVPKKRPYGMYFQIYMTIGGSGTYFGIQTELSNPNTGMSAGKGFIFSRWGDLDPRNLTTAPGGFYEIGTHEGNFIGVRMPYDVTPGRYRFTMVNTRGNWYRLTVLTPLGKQIDVGSLKLNTNKNLANFTLASEAYGMNNIPMDDVPLWQIVVDPRLNNKKPIHGLVTYPTAEYPYGFVEQVNGRERIVYGGKVRRVDGLIGDFVP